MSALEKAQLIFLDSIERNQAETAKALQGQPEAIKAAVDAAAADMRLAVAAVVDAIGRIPQPAQPIAPEPLAPVMAALAGLGNVFTMQANKIINEVTRQADRLAPKPKKWKFNIDRNYQTGKIQGVTAEVVE